MLSQLNEIEIDILFYSFFLLLSPFYSSLLLLFFSTKQAIFTYPRAWKIIIGMLKRPSTTKNLKFFLPFSGKRPFSFSVWNCLSPLKLQAEMVKNNAIGSASRWAAVMVKDMKPSEMMQLTAWLTLFEESLSLASRSWNGCSKTSFLMFSQREYMSWVVELSYEEAGRPSSRGGHGSGWISTRLNPHVERVENF